MWETGGEKNIWEDKWINDKQVRRTSSLKPEGCTMGRVKELVNQDQVGWHVHLLHQLFNEADVRAILTTPISIMGLSDKLIWPHTKTGQYSVRSGYKMAKSLKREARGNEGLSAGRDKEEERYGKASGI